MEYFGLFWAVLGTILGVIVFIGFQRRDISYPFKQARKRRVKRSIRFIVDRIREDSLKTILTIHVDVHSYVFVEPNKDGTYTVIIEFSGKPVITGEFTKANIIPFLLSSIKEVSSLDYYKLAYHLSLFEIGSVLCSPEV